MDLLKAFGNFTENLKQVNKCYSAINLVEKLKQEALNNRLIDKFEQLDRYENISPSDFKNLCFRRVAFARNQSRLDLSDMDITPNFPYINQRRMDIGTAIHTMESSQYMTFLNSEGFKVYGNWICLCCGKEIMGFKQTVCDACGGTMVYSECPIYNETYHIKGTADLVLIKDNLKIIVDYKTTTNKMIKMYKKTDNIPPDNVTQIMLYMLAINADIGILHYEDRAVEDEKDLSYDYIIDSVSEELKNRIETSKKILDKINEYDIIDLPKICESTDCETFQRCPFRTKCTKIDSMKNVLDLLI